MADYRYKALDQNGNTVEAEISAANVTEAVRSLETSGLVVVSITSAASEASSAAAVGGQGPAPGTSDSGTAGPAEPVLDRHYEAILNRRELLIPALRAVTSELPAGKTKRQLDQLIRELTGARSAAELRHSENMIRWLPLLVSGFSTDFNSQRFSDLIAYAVRDQETRNERRRVLAYPVLVMAGALLVFSLLTLLIVPVFDKMFEEFGLQLPTPTAAVVELSRQLRFHPMRMLVVALTGLATVLAARHLWAHFSLSTRLFGFAFRGNSSSLSAMSMLTGQLAELLQIGIPLADAIWIAGRGCESYYYRKAAEQLARDAHSGSPFLRQSRVANRFPANLLHALEVDRGGPSVPLLRELSTIYAERVHRRVDWTTGALTQVSIVVLGVAVGFMVVALLAPLFSLISALS